MNAVQTYPSIKRPEQLAARVSGRVWSQTRPLTRAAKPDVGRRIPRAIARSLTLWVCLLVSLPSIVLAQTTRPMSMDEAMALLDGERAWTDFPPVETILERHPEEHVLKDMLFVLDPGHGGDAHLPNWKRGPTGVREAEINLRVAKLLERMLTDAGAKVELTRDIDRDLSLADRAKVANDLDADLFISLHHNAASRPVVNYTSIYLHGDLATAGPELDAARHIARELTRTMRTDVGYSSPLMSDFQMFKSGFGVLRNARVPAMLLESSFHSNPEEEQRLDDPRHNLREAYAIYRGLVEWAFAGIPTQTIQVENNKLTAKLKTGLPAWWGDEFRGPVLGSVSLMVDGERVPFEYDAESRVLTAQLPEDGYRWALHHTNVFGHRNHPRVFGSPRMSSHAVPVNRQTYQTEIMRDPAEPWTERRTVKTPIVLLDGGAT
ncbi:MAG: N-acetylmuramoyl-L-alanine amidase, partial [Planctomycetota bacterium]